MKPSENKKKAEEQAELERKKKEFIDNGGKVEKVPPGASGDNKSPKEKLNNL